MMMDRKVDALIVGGGPAGASCAILLAKAGWSVAVVERSRFPRAKVCGEFLLAGNLPLLDRLGVGREFRESAGPDVDRVGLFAGTTVVTSRLPRPAGQAESWGRALSRERLDTLLLRQAEQLGAVVWQPCSVVRLTPEGFGFRCEVRWHNGTAPAEIESDVVIAAHGSWHPGRLPTGPARCIPRSGDLFGFKAHFVNSQLEPGLMPLLCFPSGYDGMTRCEGGRASLSCCIRRDLLTALRAESNANAGEAVLGPIVSSCRGVQRALAGARLQGAWRAAGPIRTGLRPVIRGGVFAVGNAAGEAHPVIAEGISMAIQSAFLLCRQLTNWKKTSRTHLELAEIERIYASAWRWRFGPRWIASELIANWAMRPVIHIPTLPWVRSFPALLTFGALWAGKASTAELD